MIDIKEREIVKNSRFFAAFSKLLKPMLSALALIVATINVAFAVEITISGTGVKLYTQYDQGVYLDSDYEHQMTDSTNPIDIPDKAYTVTYNDENGTEVNTDTVYGACTGVYNTSGTGSGIKTYLSKNENDGYFYITEDGETAGKGYTGNNKTWYPRYNNVAITLMTPEAKNGKRFVGWYTSSDYTTKFGDAGEDKTISRDIELHARYLPDDCYEIQIAGTNIKLYTKYGEGVYLDVDRTKQMTDSDNYVDIPSNDIYTLIYNDEDGTELERYTISGTRRVYDTATVAGNYVIKRNSNDGHYYITTKGVNAAKNYTSDTTWYLFTYADDCTYVVLKHVEDPDDMLFDGWYKANGSFLGREGACLKGNSSTIQLYPRYSTRNKKISLQGLQGTDQILYTKYGEGVYLDEDGIQQMTPLDNPIDLDNIQLSYTEPFEYFKEDRTTVLNTGDIHYSFAGYGQLMGSSGYITLIDSSGYITPRGQEAGKEQRQDVTWNISYDRGGTTPFITPEPKTGYTFDGWYCNSTGSETWGDGQLKVGNAGDVLYKNTSGCELLGFFPVYKGNKITLNWNTDGHNNAKINIPSEYTPVEYIEAHGAQSIDTGIIGAAKWELSAVGVGNTTDNLYTALVGNGSGPTQSFGTFNNKIWGIYDLYVEGYGSDNVSQIADRILFGTCYGYCHWLPNETALGATDFYFADIPSTTKANISLDFAKYSINGMVNDRVVETFGFSSCSYQWANESWCSDPEEFLKETVEGFDAVNNFDTSYKLFGFGNAVFSNTSVVYNTYFTGKLYSAKAIQNDQLVFNGIPVKRTVDGVDEYGLYDTVSGQFFGNSGTGAFTGGNDISISAPDSCVYGTKFTMPAALTDSGYTFNNWSVNGKTFNANTIEVECNYENLGVYDGSATIKANWTENPTYTITLDAETNGGTPNCTLYEKYNTDWQDDQHDECWIASSEGVTALEITPIKQNSIFKGYYTDANDGTQIIDDHGLILVDTDYFNDDATVYAQFANCVKPNGGANTVESWGLYISDMNQCYWDAACAPNYTSDTFIRIDDADVPGVTVYSAPGVPTTTEPMPDCRPNVYDITLNYVDLEDHVYEKYGTGWYHDSETHTPVNSENPENIPTVDGMKFRGYYTTSQDAVNAGVSCTPQQISEGTCSVSAPVIERSVAYANDGHSAEISRTLVLPSNTTFTADTTLYAAWAFDCEDTDPDPHAHCALYIGTNGYVQYTTSCDDGYALVSGTENTYNPQCVEDATYNVMFEKNAEDAVGNKDSVTCSVNTDCVVTNDDEITRPDYDFIGWSTSSTGTTDKYTTKINKSTTDDVTLYALWQPACVRVLHVGTGSLCLYKDKISPAGNPSLAISLDGHNTYYAAMSVSDLSMSETSTQKLHIKHGENIYNVHDLTVVE